MITVLEVVLIIGIVIGSIIWYVQFRARRRAREEMRRSLGLEVLAARYAHGEIDRDEFLEKRRDILGAEMALQGR